MTIAIKNPVTTVFKYGSYTPQYFYAIDGNFTRRLDIYKSFSTKEETGDPIICVDRNDLTPVYNGPYNSACFGCYGGHGHTELKHHNSTKI